MLLIFVSENLHISFEHSILKVFLAKDQSSQKNPTTHQCKFTKKSESSLLYLQKSLRVVIPKVTSLAHKTAGKRKRKK